MTLTTPGDPIKPVLLVTEEEQEVEERGKEAPEELTKTPSLELPPSPLFVPTVPLWSRLLSKLARAVLVLGLTTGEEEEAFCEVCVFGVLTTFVCAW